MKKVPTSRQQEILDFIRTFSAEKLMPPTLTEIAEHFNIRCSSVAYHLNALKQKGCLTRTNGSRSITFEDQGIPCRRKNCQRRIDISAHQPLNDPPGEKSDSSAGEQLENNSFFLSDFLLEICPAEHFILIRQPDDSMFELGIHQNDLVLAVPVRFKKPQLGDFVLAQLPDGSLVVRSYFSYSKKQFELVPASSDFETQTHSFGSSVVQAVVVSIQRTF